MLNHEEFLGQRLSLQGWERRRQQILRQAREARTRQLRGLVRAIFSPVRTLAATGGRLGRLIAARMGAAAGRWSRDYATWRTRRQAIAELGALDDRALKDFGINRSEIEWLVYGLHAKPVPEGKVAAFLLHKPCDKRLERRSMAATQISGHRVDRNAA
jgi:uncharacterized protein YjiS (DUF1127 family)